MRIPIILACLAGLTLACGIPCDARSGNYAVTMVQRSGTCATRVDGVVDGSTSSSAGCTGTQDVSKDGCSVSVDTICPSSTGSGAVHGKGTVEWSPTGSEGTGVMQMEITGNSAACFGTYDVTYKKL